MDFENDFGTQFGASHHNITVLGDSPSIEFGQGGALGSIVVES